MSKTLYRTYRPQKFDDVIGQDYIIKTLQNAITQNRIGHAYLFTGPRGIGKTTVARIFATAVNTVKRDDFEPVSDDIAKRLQSGQSMDIIEIDAASNTGVDDIRTLKETVTISPTEAKYKVYIIDEVHMLSTNAFNALLKTLEEPPAHVIFILATTEIHKVPDTILSRCQRFNFSRFSVEDIIKKLQTIAKNEKVSITDEALELTAISAQGGMRDAESLLAQIFAMSHDKITAETVSEILGTTTSEDVFKLLQALATSDVESAIATINDVVSNGYNMDAFIKNILEKLRILLLLTLSSKNSDIQKLITIPKSELETLTNIATSTTQKNIVYMIEECTIALQKTKTTTIIQLPMEVAAVNICNQFPKKSSETKSESTQQKDSQQREKTISKSTEKSNTSPKNSTTKETELTRTNSDLLKKSLLQIEKENKSISTMIDQCDIYELNDSTITFITTFSFYQEKIMDNENRIMIENILKKNFNKALSINVITEEKDSTSNTSELLSYASQLMGGTVTE